MMHRFRFLLVFLAASIWLKMPAAAQNGPFAGLFDGPRKNEETRAGEVFQKDRAAPRAEGRNARRAARAQRQAASKSGRGTDVFIGEVKGTGLFGAKRVEINLTTQTLQAYEGSRLVMQSRISSGRGGSTPTGRYTAGPYKAANHYSSLYQGAHMPWSVQFRGHYFIHGFASVPDYPASHGCIRLPVSGNNPARRFFEWVDVGTPIHIFY